MEVVRTNSADKDFINLVKELDADLAIRDGDDHAFYARYNKIDSLNHVLVIYLDDIAVGCGAMKEVEKEAMEIKRMFVLPMYRKKGLATKILYQLEIWAKESGYKKCVLETGLRQPEAIALYRKNKYQQIPNYGQYAGVKNSVCFEKRL